MNAQLKTAFLVIACLRVSQLFIDYNYDRADQYWQGSEVAYKIYYGYGYLSWEWTMDEPIRSPLYQLYLSLGYALCQSTYCTSYLREIAPKVMQLLLSLCCDYFLLKTAAHYVRSISTTVCLLLLTNWYYFSMLNRIYINSAETCLSVISFYFWTTREENKVNDYISRLFVVINFSLRPTSLFMWAVIWPYELLTKKSGKIMFVLKNALQLIVIALFSLAVGSLWYGRPVWIDYNFFKVMFSLIQYNVFLKFSQLYGVNAFFQYFYLVVPFIMASYLVPFILSVKEQLPFLKNWWEGRKVKDHEQEGKVEVVQVWEGKKYWELFILTLLILLFLSLSTHKEPRFLLVLTPLLLILCIKGFQRLQNNKILLLLIVIVNVGLFGILTLSTKTGGTQILRDLRQQIDSFPPEEHRNITVMYLCEPHSLPLMTIIQRDIDFRLIDTSPFRKLEHFNQQQQLHNNARHLFEDMSKGKDPDFVIIQQKYSNKGAHLNEGYGFLLSKGYKMIAVHRNINVIEEQFLGWDGLALLRK